MLPSEDISLERLNVTLRVIGRLPRILSGALFAISAPISLNGWFDSNSVLLVVCASGVPLIFFALALRVRAWAGYDSLVVHSYLKNHTVRFNDVMGFFDSGYAGLWNRYTGGETWLNFGLRMIDVYPLRGRIISLPATMMGRRSSTVIVEMLNGRVPREMPSSDGSSP